MCSSAVNPVSVNPVPVDGNPSPPGVNPVLVSVNPLRGPGKDPEAKRGTADRYLEVVHGRYVLVDLLGRTTDRGCLEHPR